MMIGEVICRVGHGIDEIHPSKFEGSEKREGRSEQSGKSSLNTLFDSLLAICILDHRAIQNGIGWRNSESSDAPGQYIF